LSGADPITRSHASRAAQGPDTDQNVEEFKRWVQARLASRVRHTENDPNLICAAVLIPLLYRDGEWHVLVTQRTEQVEHHKGQISFPGGARDIEDAGLGATALRETFEEIGVPPERVEILGQLDDLPTISHFIVTPFVGVIPHPFAYRLNRSEVEAVVEVPLSFLRDATHLRVEQREHEGRLHEVLFWEYGPYVIWGATARILKTLLDLI
jgi:8-oxo-dGTP pyrophosphatase MutT (NUDIX family)